MTCVAIVKMVIKFCPITCALDIKLSLPASESFGHVKRGILDNVLRGLIHFLAEPSRQKIQENHVKSMRISYLFLGAFKRTQFQRNNFDLLLLLLHWASQTIACFALYTLYYFYKLGVKSKGFSCIHYRYINI